MKRYAVVLFTLVASLLATHTLFAQGGGDAIVLNDATPGIDVVITTAPGTTGAISLELVQASVIIVDSAGTTVFQMADPRVHKLELRLAPGTGTYTLTAERLPGVAEAYLRVSSQADLTPLSDIVLVADSGLPLGLQQSIDLPLTAAAPSQASSFSIPADQQGTVQLSFPGAPVTAQVVDAAGQVIATMLGGGFDGLSMDLEGGSYSLTLLNANPAQETVANLQIALAAPSDFAATIPALAAATTCALTVDTASVNLRSGPGTGYSVIDYGFRNDLFQVGGVNADGSWLVVATKDGGSAWVSSNTGTLTDTCQNLTVYSIPFRDAPKPQVVIVQQPPSVVVVPAASSGGGTTASAAPAFHGDDDGEEHEED